MKKIVFLLLCSTISTLFGQEPEFDPNANFSNRNPAMAFLFMELRDKNNVAITSTDDIVGSPYLQEKYVKSKVYYEDDFVGDYFVRYNAFNSEMEIKETALEDEKPQRLMADKNISVTYGNRSLRFTTYINKKGETKNGYLSQLISEGSYKLFHRLAVKFSEGKAAANSMVNPVPSRFAHFEEFYYQEEGVDRIDYLPSSKGKFIKQFDKTIRENLKKFIKENSIDLSSEDHLIKTFEYINSL